VLRVARTLADLDARDMVVRIDVAEALSYRQRLVTFMCAGSTIDIKEIRFIKLSTARAGVPVGFQGC
jgi:hypothetical protein